MAFYRKTQQKFERAVQSTNRDTINNIFENFVRNNHETNISFLTQRAIKNFGSQVTPEMVEDICQDIYLNLLLIDEEQLLKMEETDLIKLFRSYVNGPACVGALFQQIKYANHEDLDDYEI